MLEFLVKDVYTKILDFLDRRSIMALSITSTSNKKIVRSIILSYCKCNNIRYDINRRVLLKKFISECMETNDPMLRSLEIKDLEIIKRVHRLLNIKLDIYLEVAMEYDILEIYEYIYSNSEIRIRPWSQARRARIAGKHNIFIHYINKCGNRTQDMLCESVERCLYNRQYDFIEIIYKNFYKKIPHGIVHEFLKQLKYPDQSETLTNEQSLIQSMELKYEVKEILDPVREIPDPVREIKENADRKDSLRTRARIHRRRNNNTNDNCAISFPDSTRTINKVTTDNVPTKCSFVRVKVRAVNKNLN